MDSGDRENLWNITEKGSSQAISGDLEDLLCMCDGDSIVKDVGTTGGCGVDDKKNILTTNIR